MTQRFSVVPTPDSGCGSSGYLIYDNDRCRTLGSPTYPGYWRNQVEADIICAKLNERNAARLRRTPQP